MHRSEARRRPESGPGIGVSRAARALRHNGPVTSGKRAASGRHAGPARLEEPAPATGLLEGPAAAPRARDHRGRGRLGLPGLPRHRLRDHGPQRRRTAAGGFLALATVGAIACLFLGADARHPLRHPTPGRRSTAASSAAAAGRPPSGEVAMSHRRPATRAPPAEEARRQGRSRRPARPAPRRPRPGAAADRDRRTPAPGRARPDRHVPHPAGHPRGPAAGAVRAHGDQRDGLGRVAQAGRGQAARDRHRPERQRRTRASGSSSGGST